jgi:vesicle transport through interaction with t-SNAREs 1
MSLFDEYEQEFINAARLVSTKIGQFNYNNGDADAQKALDSAKKGLGDARSLLKQMEVTARSLEPAARNQARPKLAQYKKTLAGLEADLQRTDKGALFGGRSNDMTSMSMDHRGRMMSTTDNLRRQGDTLTKAQNTLAETEEVALGVMDELDRNRRTINSARSKANRTANMTDKARWLVRDMNSRNTKQKVFLCFVIIGLITMVGLIIYWLSQNGNSETNAPAPSP